MKMALDGFLRPRRKREKRAVSKKEKFPEDIAAMSFEDALRELEDIVNRLEAGDVALEESLEIYQRGALLRAYCGDKLKSAQAKIEKVTGNGSAREDLDVE